MLRTITQCDMCGDQQEQAKEPLKDWVHLIMNGIPSVPVVALTRDLCPECVSKFIGIWMGQTEPKLWTDASIERATSQVKP